ACSTSGAACAASRSKPTRVCWRCAGGATSCCGGLYRFGRRKGVTRSLEQVGLNGLLIRPRIPVTPVTQIVLERGQPCGLLGDPQLAPLQQLCLGRKADLARHHPCPEENKVCVERIEHAIIINLLLPAREIERVHLVAGGLHLPGLAEDFGEKVQATRQPIGT